MPFLTALDSRAAVRGSRDPLGIQAIWMRFGRHVVGNLSTVSNSVRDFVVLILGYHFAEAVAANGEAGSELSTFLKWEQLAGYARTYVNNEQSFRGTTRVSKRLSEGSKVILSPDRSDQILSNQKIYGLWGLYSVPGRSSGLIDPDLPRPSPIAKELIEAVYLPILSKRGFGHGERIVQLLSRKSATIDVAGRDADLVRAVAALMGKRLTEAERVCFRDHLVYGGPSDRTRGLQRQLVEILTPSFSQDGFAFNPKRLLQLARDAEKLHGADSALAARLARISVCERVIGPSAAVFTFLLGYDNARISQVASDLRTAWGPRLDHIDAAGFVDLKDEIAEAFDHDRVSAERWVRIAETLSQGLYEETIALLLAQNRQVMNNRGGSAPWVEEQKGKLKVRFLDETGYLPERKHLPVMWRFPYFLDALHAISRTILVEAV